MTTDEFRVNIGGFKAVANACMKDDLRSGPRNGVHVERHENESVVIASDGRWLLAFSTPTTKAHPGPMYDFTLPEQVVKNMVRTPAKYNDAFFYLRLEENKVHIRTSHGTTLITEVHEAPYPNWRVVVPTEFDGIPPILSPHLMAQFSSALACIGCKTDVPDGLYCSNGPSIYMSHSLMAIIMPYRPAKPNAFTIPDIYQLPTTEGN